jgi:hypothetical protein
MILEIKNYVDAHGKRVVEQVEAGDPLSFVMRGSAPHREFSAPIQVGETGIPVSVPLPVKSLEEAYAFIESDKFHPAAEEAIKRKIDFMKREQARRSLATPATLPLK